MAYGTTPDLFDEYIKIGEKTAAFCLDNFCRCVFHLFAPVYLRKPIADDIARLYNFYAQKHGLPGMLGSIDCMHWQCKNCPIAWQGQYTRDQKGPSIMLEAVASQDLWIWHALFGMTDWAMLVKAPHNPIDEPRKKFKRFQENARKDIERAFGVLQGRFAMLKTPARSMDFNKTRRHMYACVVLHNMIQENNGFVISKRDERMIVVPSNRHIRLERNLRDRDVRVKEIRDRQWIDPPLPNWYSIKMVEFIDEKKKYEQEVEKLKSKLKFARIRSNFRFVSDGLLVSVMV
ncbi:uncharacterized protein [Rutidosis leptorrhynchoides]|uniref:uncharacterized protein n=1 Tax=Rutidosis leptorrhynchoides TaxID=125765 RepID=UPI003A9916EC